MYCGIDEPWQGLRRVGLSRMVKYNHECDDISPFYSIQGRSIVNINKNISYIELKILLARCLRYITYQTDLFTKLFPNLVIPPYEKRDIEQ
jgi:hypothetical protein